MKLDKIVKDEKGFFLIESLIALALLSLLATTILVLLPQMKEIDNKLDEKIEYQHNDYANRLKEIYRKD